MSKFNTVAIPKNRTTNLAGAPAYTVNAEFELASIVLTSFCEAQYYRGANATIMRIQELVKQCKAKYVAKLAIYARKEIGMRSITHVLASILAPRLSSKKWAKEFYYQIVKRPDDMSEIIAYHKQTDNKLSAAMKKGFARKLSELDEYQVSKYKMETKEWKLVDIVNLLHPKATEPLTALINGTIKSPETWEVNYTRIGQMNNLSESDKAKAKIAFWKEIIQNKKLGYMALLRNLRNMLDLDDINLAKTAYEALIDDKAIRNSLVLPFRFTSAYTEIMKVESRYKSHIISGITIAMDKAANNIPKFEGSTAVILDTSGSMRGKPSEIASVFAAMLVHDNPNVDLVMFSNTAKYAEYNPHDSILSLSQSLKFAGGGTNFSAALEALNKPYDRIILLSDMQSWIGYDVKSCYNKYCKKYGVRPFFYSFDLQGYGSTLLPESKVIELSGFSEKILELIHILELDKDTLTNHIRTSVEL